MDLIKRIIIKLDKIFFANRLLRFYANQIFFRKQLNHRSPDFNYAMTVQYAENKTGLLNLLCDKYGSDKGESKSDGNPYPWLSHTYTDVYELLFQLRRFDVQKVIECGLGTNNPNLASNMGINGKPGASLRVWRDYFVNAEVIGIDVDKNILFGEKRIKTYQCDQTSKASIESFIANAGVAGKSVDIIIDDGLHEFHGGVSLFESLNRCLIENGLYVIEDVTGPDYVKYKDYFAGLKSEFRVRFVNLHCPKRLSIGDNRLLVISRASV